MSTEDEISAVNRSFSRALAEQDVDGLLALYTDDARVDVGRYTRPKSEGKYVVVYLRQADGTLKILVDAANSDGSASP